MAATVNYFPVPATGSGGGDTVLDRAQALLPNSSITKVMGNDFDGTYWYRNAGTSGTITPSTTKKGGVATLSTTATGNRTAILMPTGTLVLLDNAQTSAWYMASRFSVTSAVDAAAGADLRLTATTPGAPQIVLGVIGSISTAFFSWLTQNNAGAVTASGATTVAVDTAMHVWEIWNDATTISFAIDGTVAATTAATNAGTNPVAPAINVANGATATARTIDADYLYICTGNPA
jgi:hypothetical protein